MTDTLTQLIDLERTMAQLCKWRSEYVAKAEAAIKQANKDFDRAAVPLGRKIARLREQVLMDIDNSHVEIETKASRQLDTGTHDPEWSQEDIDHFHELKARGARNGR